MAIADAKEYRDKFLKCPFCLEKITDRRRITTPFGNDIDGGRCSCGAVYVYDHLCKNLGDSFVDAVAMAFEWDYDALDDVDKPYEETMVRLHITGNYLLGDGDKLDKSPKFIFVRAIRDKE